MHAGTPSPGVHQGFRNSPFVGSATRFPANPAPAKAQSVALRTFYIQALALMTNRPQLDPEFGDQHEIGGAKRPTPDEYAAEIMNERTSLARLHQIKAELAGDNSLRMAMIEGLDGKAIELGRLLQRVGAKRLAEEGGNA